jgi:tRNA(Ile)-lysidine synthetase-like protein
VNSDRPQWMDSVQTCLERRVSAEDRLLLAVSGGADSMAMMAVILDELGRPPDRCVIGHVHHGIRADADRELELVRQAAESRGVRFVAAREDVPAAAGEQRLSLEAAARRLRYQALRKMAENTGCRWILTGHTMDDSAETVLMRMRSGAPWWEWTGIPPFQRGVLRPLLGVFRTDLRCWARSRNQPYLEDESNVNQRFGRNRLRTALNGHPRYWTAQTVGRLAEQGEVLRASVEALKLAARVWIGSPGRVGGTSRIGLDIDDILLYFRSLIFIPVEVAWTILCGTPEGRLPSSVRRQVNDCLRGKTPEARLRLPEDVTLLRRGRKAWLCRGTSPMIHREVSGGRIEIPELGGVLTVQEGSVDGAGHPGSVRVSKDSIRGSLWVRNWQPGDRLTPPGRPTKKISDLLSEQKLDPVERGRTLVLADDSGPLLILGGPVDARARAADDESDVMVITWSVEGQ